MNKYQVLGIVGEGAYGVVLRCKNRDTNDVVAIKKFKESEGEYGRRPGGIFVSLIASRYSYSPQYNNTPQHGVHLHNNCAIGSNITTCLHRFADDDIVRKTTLREVKILKMLQCPNIVSLLEAFRRKGKLYLVFEYVERNMLEVLEERPDGLDRESVRRYIFQLCLAIEYCHRNSVIHRDIKPENLLVSQSDRVLKLCDFGFARTVPKSGATDLTDYVATRWYRSPELLLGSTTYTAAVDVWAIGCLMGEMTDGQPLFPGDTEVDQLKLIQQGMGPLTSTQMELLLRNPNFRGMKFPDMCRAIDTLRRKYSKRLPAGALEFMRDCLRMDPKRRLSARQCVEHPWFDGLPAEFGWTPMVEPTEGAAKAASGGGRNFQPVSTRQADAVSAANSLAGFSVPHLSPTGMVMPVSRSPEAPEVPDTPGAQVGLLTGADTDAYGDGGFEPDDEDDEQSRSNDRPQNGGIIPSPRARDAAPEVEDEPRLQEQHGGVQILSSSQIQSVDTHSSRAGGLRARSSASIVESKEELDVDVNVDAGHSGATNGGLQGTNGVLEGRGSYSHGPQQDDVAEASGDGEGKYAEDSDDNDGEGTEAPHSVMTGQQGPGHSVYNLGLLRRGDASHSGPGGAGASSQGRRAGDGVVGGSGLHALDGNPGGMARYPRGPASRARSRGALAPQGLGASASGATGAVGPMGLIALAPEGLAGARSQPPTVASMGSGHAAGAGAGAANRRLRRRLRRGDGTSGDVIVQTTDADLGSRAVDPTPGHEDGPVSGRAEVMARLPSGSPSGADDATSGSHASRRKGGGSRKGTRGKKRVSRGAANADRDSERSRNRGRSQQSSGPQQAGRKSRSRTGSRAVGHPTNASGRPAVRDSEGRNRSGSRGGVRGGSRRHSRRDRTSGSSGAQKGLNVAHAADPGRPGVEETSFTQEQGHAHGKGHGQEQGHGHGSRWGRERNDASGGSSQGPTPGTISTAAVPAVPIGAAGRVYSEAAAEARGGGGLSGGGTGAGAGSVGGGSILGGVQHLRRGGGALQVVREARRTRTGTPEGGMGGGNGSASGSGSGALDWASGKRRLPRALQPQGGRLHTHGRAGVGNGPGVLEPLGMMGPVGSSTGAGVGSHRGPAARHRGRRGLRG